MQNQRTAKKRKLKPFSEYYQILISSDAYKSGKIRDVDLNNFKMDELPKMPELKMNLFEGKNHEKKEHRTD